MFQVSYRPWVELSQSNYKNGFLLDDELMAGITESLSSDAQPIFIAFVIRHTTGEYLGYRAFPELSAALQSVNAIPRAWRFESSKSCGGGSCGKKGDSTTSACSSAESCASLCSGSGCG